MLILTEHVVMLQYFCSLRFCYILKTLLATKRLWVGSWVTITVPYLSVVLGWICQYVGWVRLGQRK